MHNTILTPEERFPVFESLYHRQDDLARHIFTPFAKEREQYLAFLASDGMPPRSLLRIAGKIYWVARLVPLAPGKNATVSQIEKAADAYAHTKVHTPNKRNLVQARILFTREAMRLFRFMNRLCLPKTKPLPYENMVSDYCRWMKDERGLADKTIRNRCMWIRVFLSWYEPLRHSLSMACASDVDRFFVTSKKQHRWSRVTVATILKELRGFFRYAASRGLCKPFLAEGIPGPRLYQHGNLPRGPKREDVIRLISSMKTDRPADIRDYAMVLLCAIYGLRASEVTGLCLEDINWDQDQIHIVQAKSKTRKTFRLVPTVGNAIYRYLKKVRPRCPRKEVFLTLCSPYRPLLQMNGVVSRHLNALGIDAPQKGPHGIRHALACHLLSQNQSLKVIGDILGHRSCESTRIYAKVDLISLRHVANLDLGDVL
jgi:integrase/recombinase XerD